MWYHERRLPMLYKRLLLIDFTMQRAYTENEREAA